MKIRTIIADDEYFIRARLAKIIADNRPDIDIISLLEDGEDVIKVLNYTDIQLLIIDIKMIKLSGLEVAKYIYENKMDVKIIIISGYNEFDYAIEAMHYGVSDYLTKPLAEDELLAAIDKCLQNMNESKNKASYKTSLISFFTESANTNSNKDMSDIRPLANKYLINSDVNAYKELICTTTDDIIKNYTVTTLYKFIREIISTLDIRYHILQNTTTTEYIDEMILSKNMKTISDLDTILIDLGIDCMSLNIQTTKEQILCKSILEDIEKHFGESTYTVSDIAKNVGKNSSYLNSVFKKAHGHTVVQALNNYRLEKAKEILKLGKHKIAEVARICGYTDMFYFSKKYKAKFGYPPSEENLKL